MNLSATHRDTPGACVGFDAGMAAASSTQLGPSCCDAVALVRNFQAPSSYNLGLHVGFLTNVSVPEPCGTRLRAPGGGRAYSPKYGPKNAVCCSKHIEGEGR